MFIFSFVFMNLGSNMYLAKNMLLRCYIVSYNKFGITSRLIKRLAFSSDVMSSDSQQLFKNNCIWSLVAL